MTIDTVVVTYNRKKMLANTLNAILNQSCSIRFLYIIDNASTDGTQEYISDLISDSRVKYRRMETNTGGSGGFYEGLKQASDADWVWIMDDDVVPEPSCLEELVKAQGMIKEKISFLASTIYGPNGEPMNVPHISDKKAENGYVFWYKYIEQGIVSIKDATFVSLLINGEAIRKCGLPCKDYFIWGDDSEYTTRLTTYYGEAFFIGKSKALHNRVDAKALSIMNESDPKRRKMYHYLFRNNAINQKFYDNKYIFPRLCKEMIKLVIAPVARRSVAAQFVVVKGKFEALVQYRKFKRYIVEQIGSHKA